MPYTNDLVRLAVSVSLAIRENHLDCKPADACEAILAGYRESLGQGGLPFVLAEQHHWLRELATHRLRNPALFWQKFDPLPRLRSGVPTAVRAELARALPNSHLPFQIVHRHAGLGSLGRRRFTALAQWRGGWIARETKQLLVSAWYWEKPTSANILYYQAIARAVRVPDPFLYIKGSWLIRRLAPDCSRIELSSLPRRKDELKLLHAMGWETANIHLGSPRAVRPVLNDLKQRPAKWLVRATESMSKATLADWTSWTESESLRHVARR
jgi:uncharacterized protein (DUF2252 family)